jgi:hypothetical protein
MGIFVQKCMWGVWEQDRWIPYNLGQRERGYVKVRKNVSSSKLELAWFISN